MPILKQLGQHKVLLDTHVFIWILSGKTIFSSSFQKKLDALLEIEHVYISIISIWEMAMLVEKKRVEIDRDMDEVVQQTIESRFQILPMSPQIAIQSTRLPGEIHGDPADRIIVASSFLEKATLVTCNHQLLHYAQDKLITAFDPSK